MAYSLSRHTHSFPSPSHSSTPLYPTPRLPCWARIILLNCSRPNMAGGHTAPSSIRNHEAWGIGYEPHTFPSPSNVTLSLSPHSALYQHAFNSRTYESSMSARITYGRTWTSLKLSTSTADIDQTLRNDGPVRFMASRV
jgi:hypothetical protein